MYLFISPLFSNRGLQKFQCSEPSQGDGANRKDLVKTVLLQRLPFFLFFFFFFTSFLSTLLWEREIKFSWICPPHASFQYFLCWAMALVSGGIASYLPLVGCMKFQMKWLCVHGQFLWDQTLNVLRRLLFLCKPMINYHYYTVTQKQCLHKASTLLLCAAFCQSCLSVESFT